MKGWTRRYGRRTVEPQEELPGSEAVLLFCEHQLSCLIEPAVLTANYAVAVGLSGTKRSTRPCGPPKTRPFVS